VPSCHKFIHYQVILPTACLNWLLHEQQFHLFGNIFYVFVQFKICLNSSLHRWIIWVWEKESHYMSPCISNGIQPRTFMTKICSKYLLFRK
jgi:hypothetical protein